MPDQITMLADRLITGKIDPVPRYRLMRDVLLLPDEHPDMKRAYEAAMQSRLVRELLQAQHPDGSFGRFYSRNKQVRYAARTTETAQIRAMSLGMKPDHILMQRLKTYYESILRDEITWPDRPDPSLDWPLSIRMVTAARLRQIEPDHPLALAEAERTHQLIEAAFADGDFSELNFNEVYEDLFDAPPEFGSRMLFSQYALIIVGGLLPYEIEERLTRHIIENCRGIYLINNRSLKYPPLAFQSRESLRYIRALELLALYPSSADLLIHAADWIWEQQSNNGLWDMGPLARDGLELPLSDSWRQGQRSIDCTVILLGLQLRLQRTCDLRDKICHPR